MANTSTAKKDDADFSGPSFAKDQLKSLVERIERLEEVATEYTALQALCLIEAARLWWPNGEFASSGRKLHQQAIQRFLSSVEVDNETLCWNWRGSMNLNGYGGFPYKARRWLAHRWIYSVANGQIPSNLVIDHTCRNKRCVNITHLEAVTQSTNVKRSFAEPREIPDFLSGRP